MLYGYCWEKTILHDMVIQVLFCTDSTTGDWENKDYEQRLNRLEKHIFGKGNIMSWTFIKRPVPGAEFGLTAENRNHVLGYIYLLEVSRSIKVHHKSAKSYSRNITAFILEEKCNEEASLVKNVLSPFIYWTVFSFVTFLKWSQT